MVRFTVSQNLEVCQRIVLTLAPQLEIYFRKKYIEGLNDDILKLILTTETKDINRHVDEMDSLVNDICNFNCSN